MCAVYVLDSRVRIYTYNEPVAIWIPIGAQFLTQSKFLLVPDRTQYQPPNDVVVDVVAEHSLAPCAVVTSLTEVKTVAGTALRG